jgi:D-alanyl-D-alanine carboxypeptidase
MCGNHRKRPATEDEDDVVTANMAPDSPYAVFLSSLRPPKTKGASLLNDGNMGDPVLVYTGAKPPAPGTQQAGWGEPKPKGKKSATAKLTSGKDKAGKDKDAAKDSAKDKDTAATGSSDGGAAPKPKPKKPKNAPIATTPAQTSQAR